MDCKTFLTYLSDYIDQQLEADLSEAARQHVATCPNCSVMLDSTQKTILIYQSQVKKTLPLARRQRLYEQLAAAFAQRPQPPQ